MILIIGQTFVNLSPGQVWKAPHNVIDAGTVDDQTDHVVHKDADNSLVALLFDECS